MPVKRVYKDVRVFLSSPEEILVNDRLQRNADTIEAVTVQDSKVLVATRWEVQELSKANPIYVWRLTLCS